MIYIYEETVCEELPKEEPKQVTTKKESPLVKYAFHPMYNRSRLTEETLLRNGFIKEEGPSWQYKYNSDTEEIFVDIKYSGSVMHRRGPSICWSTHEYSVPKLQAFLTRRGSKVKIEN